MTSPREFDDAFQLMLAATNQLRHLLARVEALDPAYAAEVIRRLEADDATGRTLAAIIRVAGEDGSRIADSPDAFVALAELAAAYATDLVRRYDQIVGAPPRTPHADALPPRLDDQVAIAAVQRDDHYQTDSSLLFTSVRRALAINVNAFRTVDGWPTADLSNAKRAFQAYAQFTPDPVNVRPFLTDTEAAELQRLMARRLLQADDLTADVLDIIVAVWLQKANYPDEMVIVSADDFLKLRGLLPHQSGDGRRGGYGNDKRHQIARHVGLLKDVYITVQRMAYTEEAPGRDGKPVRRRAQYAGVSPLIQVGLTFGQVEFQGRIEPFAWRVRPGDTIAKFLFGPGRQTALISHRALQYDPHKERWEKRLTRYFAWQWRIRQSGERYLDPLAVATVLDAVGEPPDHARPHRTRDRLERALDRLQADGVLAAWHYVAVDDDALPARGWLAQWMGWRLQAEPPARIIDHYATIRPGPTPARALPPPPPTTPAEQLRAVRLDRGVSQLAAADQIGIHHSRLSRIERGQRPTRNEADKIARWLQAIGAPALPDDHQS